MSIKLTTRQREVLDLLSEGLLATQVGEKLGLSPNTVKAHVRLLKNKFDISSGNTTLLITRYRAHFPGPDRLWTMIADKAVAGESRDATAILLAQLINDKVSVDEIADRMTRSKYFVQNLADYGQRLLHDQECSGDNHADLPV